MLETVALYTPTRPLLPKFLTYSVNWSAAKCLTANATGPSCEGIADQGVVPEGCARTSEVEVGTVERLLPVANYQPVCKYLNIFTMGTALPV